jgi:Flp pilus assembly protein TadD
MKNAEAAALANASRELLTRGDAIGAERVLTPVFAQLRADASVLHLMGQIKRAQNQLEAAESHFRRAVAYALDDGTYYNDLGVVLQARGQFDEAIKVFRAALALLPHVATARVNLVRCLMAARRLDEADEEARAYIAAAESAEAWTLLSQVQRAQDKNEDALVSAAAALRVAPQTRGLRLNHAIALERVGRNKEALEAYHRMALQEIDTPELALNLSRALYLEGAKEEAEQTLSEAVRHWPEIVGMHNNLARMRQLRGEGEASTALMEAEIERRPDDLALRLACADVLHRGRHFHRALRVLE